MVHLLKKRTKFKKCNFVLVSDKFRIEYLLLNKKIGRSGYHFISVPFYFVNKFTVVEKKINDFIQKKTILDWL